MYKITMITKVIGKKGADKTQTFQYDEVDTPEFDAVMEEVSELLYDLDLEFNDVDGDGDMAIDDILMQISEEEPFEKTFEAYRNRFVIRGEITE